MIQDVYQRFQVEDRIRLSSFGVMIDGYNSNKSITFGGIMLDVFGNVVDEHKFSIIGTFFDGIRYVKDIIISATSSEVKITAVLEDELYTVSIVPKSTHTLNVEIFFRTNTYVTENKFHIRGGF